MIQDNKYIIKGAAKSFADANIMASHKGYDNKCSIKLVYKNNLQIIEEESCLNENIIEININKLAI